jgi:hypothetical protein
MNTMMMPGFTAEHSLYRTERYFHTDVFAFRGLDVEIRPQMRCVPVDGDLICEIPVGGGGGGGDHRRDIEEKKCVLRCNRTESGAALKKCIANC